MWCHPRPPETWNGNRLATRDNGVCTWGEELPNQCFGFGMEKLGGADGKSKLNTQECAQACCNDSTCDSW